jgi:hypothetical protein
VQVTAPQLTSERPRVKRRREEDGIETRDSTCHLQRQVDKPKYILKAYTSPNCQATKYEAETANSTASQPRCPSEDVYETRVRNISPETHALTADATTTSRIQAGSRTYPSPQGVQASLVPGAGYITPPLSLDVHIKHILPSMAEAVASPACEDHGPAEECGGYLPAVPT